MIKSALIVGLGSFVGGALKMLQNGHGGSFLVYVSVSVIAGIGLTGLGYGVVK